MLDVSPVDMVVGMYWSLGSHFPSNQFDGAIADDLIGVHVGLGTGTSLPDHKGKVII